MDVEQLESLITPRTVGIIPVHLYGHPVNLDRVFQIAAKHKLWVLEDCAQAQGAKYNGKTVGSHGQLRRVLVFPVEKSDRARRRRLSRDERRRARRKSPDALRNHGRKDKYHHEFAGFNVRFNEIQGAIGRVMLKHLDGFNDNRRKIAARYNERLKGIVTTPVRKPWARAVYHMYVIRSRKTRRTAKIFGRTEHRDRHPLSGAEPSATRRSRTGSKTSRACPRPSKR